MKFLLIIPFLLFSALSLAGQEHIVERFRRAAITGLIKASQQGQKEINGIAIKELITRAETIAIVFDPNLRVTTLTRRCAYWQNYSKTNHKWTAYIRLNADCITLSDEELEGLALHEILGAAAGTDEDYEHSAVIQSGVRLQNKVLDLNKLKKNLDKIKMNQFGGGATGVGGGGDIRDLKFKIEGLKKLQAAGEFYLGIPTEILKEALARMKIHFVRGGLKSILQFEKNSPDNPGRFLIVDRILLPEHQSSMGVIALNAARLQVLFDSYSIGLTESPRITKSQRLFSSSVIAQPYLYLPFDLNSVIILENEELTKNLTEEEKKATRQIQEKIVFDLLKTESYQSDVRIMEYTTSILVSFP